MSIGCQHPNRNPLSKDLLDVIHDQSMERNLILIKKESDIFGLLFIGDGTTISIPPPLKIFVSGKNIPVSVLELVYFQVKLRKVWGKRWNLYMQYFIEHMRNIDLHKTITYVVISNGDSNVQIGGELLK